MVFAENGRLALLNPFVLLRMFDVHGGVDENRLPRMRATRGNVPHYIKPSAELALRRQFSFPDYNNDDLRKFDPPFFLVKTAFLVAEVIYHTHQATVTEDMYHNLSKLLVQERIHLQKVFLSTDKFKKRAEVPNIHLANHYQQDVQLYGTPSNVMASLGEQMYRNPKRQVTHTNCKERLLQLEKAVNNVQTMRHMADGAFPNHPFTAQFSRVMESCTYLKESFLGSPSQSKAPKYTTPSNKTDSDTTTMQIASIPARGRLDTLHTIFDRMRVKQPVKLSTAKAYGADIPIILQAYTQQYGTSIYEGMSYKVHYWHSLVGEMEEESSTKRIRLKTGGFVRRTIDADGSLIVGGPSTGSRMDGVFYQVDRIATVLIGSRRRAMLICWPMTKVPDELVYLAPYEVYRRDMQADQPIVLGLHSISPENLHFVPKSAETWWWNCFVVSFN